MVSLKLPNYTVKRISSSETMCLIQTLKLVKLLHVLAYEWNTGKNSLQVLPFIKYI